MPILTNEQTFVLSHIFPIRMALKPEGKIARLNYKDFYIASLHEILRLKYFSFLLAHDNCNHPLYLTSLMFYVSMYEFRHHFAAIFIFLFGKTNMPYCILLFSFAKALGNLYIVNNMFKLARNKSRIIKQLYCGCV